MLMDDFKALVTRIEGGDGYCRPQAFAVGIASFGISDLDNSGVVGSPAKILDTWYPAANVKENYGTAAVLSSICGYREGAKTSYLDLEQVEQALSHFAAFANDGKRHHNIEALNA